LSVTAPTGTAQVIFAGGREKPLPRRDTLR
jgi:hypothetical protein